MFTSTSSAIVAFVVIFTILIVVLVYIIILYVSKYQEKQKSLEELKIAHKNKYLRTQLEVQEQTFHNISQDIHDNIGQKLTLAKFLLNSINEKTSNPILLSESITMISGVLNDLRDLSRSLSSEIVLQNGLLKAVEFEGFQIEKSGSILFEYQTYGSLHSLNDNTSLVIFRIIQEILQNIMKHSEATKITMKILEEGDKLRIHISDDGKGFIVHQNERTSQGLNNISRRTSLLEGICNIHSEPGKGTSINLEIPINGKSIN